MFTILTLTRASLKMFMRNRQALFFSLFMPMMILCIFGAMNFDKPAKFHVGLVQDHPNAPTQSFINNLKSQDAFQIDEGPLDPQLAALNAGNRALVLIIPNALIPETFDPATLSNGLPRPTVYTNAGRPVDSQIALGMLNGIMMKQMLEKIPGGSNAKPLFAMETKSVSAKNPRYIEFLLPGIVAMSVMQMSVFSVAFIFARYRETGVLKRLLATPMLPSQFVTANILTRLIMSFSQAAIFILAGIALFHIHIAGNFASLALCIALGALMFLGLGFTISGLAKTLETVPVYSNLLVFPQLFLGNVFFSIADMPNWLRTVAHFLPLTFFSSALRAVMTDGASLYDIRTDLLGLTLWAAILVTTAVLTFRIQGRDAT